MNRIAIILIVSLFSVFVRAEFSVPALTGPVVDRVGVVSGSDEQQISSWLHGLKNETGIQGQVLIVDTLDGESVEGAAVKVYDQWKLGTKKDKKGFLLFIAVKDHKLRIEVGRGLEGELTDLYSKRIITEVIVPAFRQKQISYGVKAGVAKIIQTASPEYGSKIQVGAPQQSRHASERDYSGQTTEMPAGVVIFIILLLILISIARFFGGFGGGGGYYGGGGSWGGGSSSGGGDSWSGDGGDSAGGGASGDW